MRPPYSRFATVDEVFSSDFVALNQTLNELTVEYGLADHTEINADRYPWSVGLLGQPAFYAARLWEYPFALLAAELQPGMHVADIGCGMTAFTLYLKECAGCDVVGLDPDVFPRKLQDLGHGVTREFLRRSGLKVAQSGMEALPIQTGSLDRVFSLSVMEHVPREVARKGIQEMARVLKPGGRAVLTLDVSMWFELNRPLDLVWDSGLLLMEPVDFRWPMRRFGMFSDTHLPADVLGMTLIKEEYPVDIQYRRDGQAVPSVPLHRVPTMIPRPGPDRRPLWRRAAGRLRREIRHAWGTTTG